MLVEMSSFWFYLGVLTTICHSVICVAAVVTMDESCDIIIRCALPIVAFAYLQSVYCQPRRHRPEDM